MARTDSTAVILLLADNYDSDAAVDVDQFIGMASRMVDRMVACATRKGLSFLSDELVDIEKLLAAHFYQMSDEGYTSKSTGKASGAFKGQYTTGLDRTTYGQGAMTLDFSGCLASASKGIRVGGSWLGKTDSEKTSYRDRN